MCIHVHRGIVWFVVDTERVIFLFTVVTKTQIPLVRNYRHCVERNLPSPPAEHCTSVGYGALVWHTLPPSCYCYQVHAVLIDYRYVA